jgi:hypothetical protein
MTRPHPANQWLRRLRHTILIACIGAASAAQAAESQDISPAETLLFQTDHLARVKAPATLAYTYHKAGSAEPGFDDKVEVDVAKGGAAAAPMVSMRFLSGSNKRETPAIENPRGNPVLLGFLERDIAEMKRLTGGSANYFRKRIRLALAEQAQVRPASFRFQGKQWEGREITVQPYLNDPLQERFPKYLKKSYTFMLSEQLPGGVYQIRSSVPGAGAQPDQPLLEETLTLAGGASAAR